MNLNSSFFFERIGFLSTSRVNKALCEIEEIIHFAKKIEKTLIFLILLLLICIFSCFTQGSKFFESKEIITRKMCFLINDLIALLIRSSVKLLGPLINHLINMRLLLQFDKSWELFQANVATTPNLNL